MGQFECPICHETFEQKSVYERHMETSHPRQAASAADVQEVLSGISYPKSKNDLIEYAKSRSAAEGIVDILKELPDTTYRDAAELSRYIGQLKTHTSKPTYQPSKKGGKTAVESTENISAAQIAQELSGIKFPKTADEIKLFVSGADEKITNVIGKLPDKTYNDMSDVTKALQTILGE